MSYTFTPYLVDLGMLSRAFGSKDEKLLATLQEKFAEQLQELDEFLLENESDISKFSAADALSEMIRGECSRPDCADLYCFAFDILCQHLGEALHTEYFVDCHSSWLSAVGFLDKWEGRPIPIPSPQYDLDMLYVTRQEAASELNEIRDADLSHQDRQVEFGRQEYLDWLEEAVHADLDFVLISH